MNDTVYHFSSQKLVDRVVNTLVDGIAHFRRGILVDFLVDGRIHKAVSPAALLDVVVAIRATALVNESYHEANYQILS